MDIRVDVLDEATDEAVEAFARLLPQLSTSAPPLTRSGLAAVLARPTTPCWSPVGTVRSSAR